MALRCEIVTPEQNVFDRLISSAVVPAHDGLLGVLKGRAPLLARLGSGGLAMDLPDGSRITYFVSGGVVQVRDDVITVLTEQAVPAGQLDADQARAELAEATSKRITDDASFEQRQAEVERAQAKVRLAGR